MKRGLIRRSGALGLLLLSSLLTQGCEQLRGANASATRFDPEASMLMTQVDPLSAPLAQKDWIFEPDYRHEYGPGRAVWGLMPAVETQFLPAFIVTFEAAGKVHEVQLLKKSSGDNDPELSPYDFMRNEFESNAALQEMSDKQVPTYSIAKYNAAAQGPVFAHLAVYLPERLLPDFAAGTGRLRIFKRDTQTKDGQQVTVDLPAGEFLVTRRAVRNMLVLGDSVMWGQGLREEDKYSNLVARTVLEKTNVPIRSLRYAHSGAILAAPPEGAAGCTEDIHNRPRPGEISQTTGQPEHRSHRIPCQLESFKRRPDRLPIDYVLVNGCANDMDIAKLGLYITAGWFDDTDAKRKEISDKCYGGMKAMLQSLRATSQLADAKIIVTGYYSPVTAGSILRNLGEDPSVRGTQEQWIGRSLENSAVDRSTLWHTTSNSSLLRAVQELDAQEQRIRFVPLEAPESSGIFATEPFVWDYAPNQVDPLLVFRNNHCIKYGRDKDFFCLGAGIIHPNTRGAARYATRVVHAMESMEDYPTSRLPVGGSSACVEAKFLKVSGESLVPELPWEDTDRDSAGNLIVLKAEKWARGSCPKAP